MAIDSARKRFAFIGLGSPLRVMLPPPDNDMQRNDLYNFMSLYYLPVAIIKAFSVIGIWDITKDIDGYWKTTESLVGSWNITIDIDGVK
jgi:hypothetical protein